MSNLASNRFRNFPTLWIAVVVFVRSVMELLNYFNIEDLYKYEDERDSRIMFIKSRKCYRNDDRLYRILMIMVFVDGCGSNSCSLLLDRGIYDSVVVYL